MSTIKLFETRQVRSLWDEERETWYFSIVDVVAILTGSADPGAYWRKLKERLKTDELEDKAKERLGDALKGLFRR